MPPTKRGGGATKAAAAPKKPGPKPGRPRRKNGAGGKTYRLYTVDGENLLFLTKSNGVNGDIAAVNAVKAGSVEAGTPVIALTENMVGKVTTVEPEERDPKYVVKKATAKASNGRRGPRKKAEPEATTEEPETASEEAVVEEEKPKAPARRGGRRGKAKAPAAPAGNPFA